MKKIYDLKVIDFQYCLTTNSKSEECLLRSEIKVIKVSFPTHFYTTPNYHYCHWRNQPLLAFRNEWRLETGCFPLGNLSDQCCMLQFWVTSCSPTSVSDGRQIQCIHWATTDFSLSQGGCRTIFVPVWLSHRLLSNSLLVFAASIFHQSVVSLFLWCQRLNVTVTPV